MRFTEAPQVNGKQLTEDEQLELLKKKLSLNNLYKTLIFNRLKGDKYKLTMFTLVVMLLSEVPIYFFTLLDILKLESLFKYRLHYIKDQADHLGIRNYPPNSITWRTMKTAEFNFFFAYFFPAALGMKIGSLLGLYIYDTEADENKLTWTRFIKEFVIIALLADFGFYSMHRLFHQPSFYIPLHKKHHDFKYSIAFAHHWASYGEALWFLIPQVLPPLLSCLLLKHKCHVTSLWAGMFFTQINAILGHAGYQLPFVPSWFPFFQSSFHDFHHVDYSCNFGAVFPFIDKLFGTYVTPIVEKDMHKVMAMKPMSDRVFG